MTSFNLNGQPLSVINFYLLCGRGKQMMDDVVKVEAVQEVKKFNILIKIEVEEAEKTLRMKIQKL